MKANLSISIDKDLVKKLQEHVAKGRFRNKSHVVEFAIKNLNDASQDF